MCDAGRVSDALKHVQGAYYCPPFDPYMIQGAVAFAVAAKEARLEHIVGLRQWLASPSHPSLTRPSGALRLRYRCVSRLPQKESDRKKRIRHDKKANKKRDVIERCLGRLKDFRRNAHAL
jgi:hypothetical protein